MDCVWFIGDSRVLWIGLSSLVFVLSTVIYCCLLCV